MLGYLRTPSKTYDALPYITFIIPSIGRPTLSRTIESLKNLNDPNWKAIIVFDGIEPTFYPDDSRVTICAVQKQGYYNCAGCVRNQGIKLVRTRWVGFVDDDDILLPNYIDAFRRQLHRNPDVIILRMLTPDGIFPPLEDADFSKGLVGISFCAKTSLFQENNLWFISSTYEDFYLLDKWRRSFKKIVISPETAYIVRPSE